MLPESIFIALYNYRAGIVQLAIVQLFTSAANYLGHIPTFPIIITWEAYSYQWSKLTKSQ